MHKICITSQFNAEPFCAVSDYSLSLHFTPPLHIISHRAHSLNVTRGNSNDPIICFLNCVGVRDTEHKYEKPWGLTMGIGTQRNNDSNVESFIVRHLETPS